MLFEKNERAAKTLEDPPANLACEPGKNPSESFPA